MKKQCDKLDTFPPCTQLHYTCEDLSAYLCTEFSIVFSAVQNKSKLVMVTLHIPLRRLLLDKRAPLLRMHCRTWALGLACCETPHLVSPSLTCSGNPMTQDFWHLSWTTIHKKSVRGKQMPLIIFYYSKLVSIGKGNSNSIWQHTVNIAMLQYCFKTNRSLHLRIGLYITL